MLVRLGDRLHIAGVEGQPGTAHCLGGVEVADITDEFYSVGDLYSHGNVSSGCRDRARANTSSPHQLWLAWAQVAAKPPPSVRISASIIRSARR